MTKRRLDQVADAIAACGVRDFLDIEDVVLFYNRSEYVTGDGLDSVLQEIDSKLEAKNIPEIARRSALNIVFELAFNSVIHSRTPASASELLVIGVKDGHVSVSMFGDGHPEQLDRLERSIASIRKFATPPNHRTKLLERRNEAAWRRRKVPESTSGGGGFGMLTIAALSSRGLLFKRKPLDHSERFMLQSIV
jgi:Family of unknown function (DUF6272)